MPAWLKKLGSTLLRRTISELASDCEAGDSGVVAGILDGFNEGLVASIFDNPNLSTAKLQSILDNANLTIQKAQEIVDAMTNKDKIGTGGRRGFLGDDFADNKLSSRDRAAVVATTFSRIYSHFRPEWTIVLGAPTVSGGIVTMASGDEMQVDYYQTEGTWEFKSRKTYTTASVGTGIYVCLIFQDKDNCWRARHGYTVSVAQDEIGLAKLVAGSVTYLFYIDYASDTVEYVSKYTRDSAGNWEGFKDGVSFGTGTDTYMPASPVGMYVFSTNGTHELHWLEVY